MKKPNKRQRIERRDIAAMRTANIIIELADKQYFCETGAAYEVWDESRLPVRLYRVPKSRVIMVWNKEETNVDGRA